MKTFNTKPEFFRFINNANEELTVRKNQVYNKNNELVAEYIEQL